MLVVTGRRPSDPLEHRPSTAVLDGVVKHRLDRLILIARSSRTRPVTTNKCARWESAFPRAGGPVDLGRQPDSDEELSAGGGGASRPPTGWRRTDSGRPCRRSHQDCCRVEAPACSDFILRETAASGHLGLARTACATTSGRSRKTTSAWSGARRRLPRAAVRGLWSAARLCLPRPVEPTTIRSADSLSASS